MIEYYKYNNKKWIAITQSEYYDMSFERCLTVVGDGYYYCITTPYFNIELKYLEKHGCSFHYMFYNFYFYKGVELL